MKNKQKSSKELNEELKAQGLNPVKPSIQELVKDYGDGRRRIRIQFDFMYGGRKGKTVEGETQTEPELTLSLGQLLERHSRGREIPMKEPVYFETEIPTFSDLTDIERYQEQLNRRVEEVNNFLKQEKEAKQAQSSSEDSAQSNDSKGVEKATLVSEVNANKGGTTADKGTTESK